MSDGKMKTEPKTERKTEMKAEIKTPAGLMFKLYVLEPQYIERKTKPQD